MMMMMMIMLLLSDDPRIIALVPSSLGPPLEFQSLANMVSHPVTHIIIINFACGCWGPIESQDHHR